MLEIIAKLLVLVLLLAWWVRHGGTKDNRAEQRTIGVTDEQQANLTARRPWRGRL